MFIFVFSEGFSKYFALLIFVHPMPKSKRVKIYVFLFARNTNNDNVNLDLVFLIVLHMRIIFHLRFKLLFSIPLTH